MAAIISGLWNASKYLPANTAMGLLKKSFPKLDGFFSKSLANGLTAHQILEFMNSKLSDNTFQEQLDNLQSKNMLTPEEKILRRREHGKKIPGKLLRAGTAYATGALLGAKEQLQPESEEQAQQPEMTPPQQPERTYDPMAGLSKFPELVQFIQREMSKGRDAMSIAFTAKKSPKLSPMVQTIERQIDEPFERLLERLLTTFKMPRQQPAMQSQPMQSSKGLSPEVIEMMKKFVAR